MEWLEGKKSGGGCLPEPSDSAILISYGRRNGEIERVRIRLSAELVKQARLQPGDKLQAGFDSQGELCFRRHPSGNAISGVGFSVGKSASNSGRPHVVFQAGSYPQVIEWTQKRVYENRWLHVVDHGSYFVVE